MRYKKYLPAKSLEPFIVCYFVWEGMAEKRTEIQSPPNGFCAMVFNYKDPYQAYQNKGGITSVPKAFASGQFTSNYTLVMEGAIGMTGVVMKPASMYNFFGTRMSTLVNNRMSLDLLLGAQAERLWEGVCNCTSDKERVAVLETFLLAQAENPKNTPTIIDEAIEYIDQYKGCVSVESVASHFRISRRYLEKKFLEKVGISPKFYARVKRFGPLSNKVAHSEKIDWQDIVFENGFHDQSHLVKEYMEFNQMNPTEYHRYHREMTRFVKTDA